MGTCHGSRRGRGGRVVSTRRHGPAGPRLRVHGHVHQLRRARRRVRGRRTTQDLAAGRDRGGDAMTTANPDDLAGRRSPAVTSWLRAARHALDRPLTAYYLLLGASGLLLTIGLIMVLSASSVYSFEKNGNSYAVVTRQLMWVAIALPCAWLASRLPTSFIRRFAWLGLGVAVVLLALVRVPGLGREVNGNQNWLGLGPIVIQPAEIAKLAIVLWAAHIYARKEKRLGSLHELFFPVVLGIGVVIVLVMLGKDLGTALVLFAILLAMLWVVGAPGRLFTMALLLVGVVALYLATTSKHRLERLA